MGKRTALVAILMLGIVYPMQAGIILADFEPDPMNVQSTAPTALIGRPLIKIGKVSTRLVKVTAYSSTPEETDDTPFITATGKYVRDGIIATNFLPFGTRVRIPSLFGDKVFVVEDRMHPRMKNVVDVWMEKTEDARKFGLHETEIAILD